MALVLMEVDSVNTDPQVLRGECRTILERFQGLLEKLQSSFSAKSSAHTINTDGSSSVYCDLPQSMDLRVWCAYLRMEFSSDQLTEAFKVGDKLLKTLVSSQSARSNIDYYACIPGAYELHWLLTRQLLGLPTRHTDPFQSGKVSTSSSSSKELLFKCLSMSELLDAFVKACRLLQCASQMNSYDGFLKPVSTEKKKTSSSSSPPSSIQWLQGSGLSIPGSMQSSGEFRRILSGMIQQLEGKIEAVRKEKKTEESIGAVRFHAVASSRADYRLVCLI
jgi:hypothetical protein